jgi:hypothetical protein
MAIARGALSRSGGYGASQLPPSHPKSGIPLLRTISLSFKEIDRFAEVSARRKRFRFVDSLLFLIRTYENSYPCAEKQIVLSSQADRPPFRRNSLPAVPGESSQQGFVSGHEQQCLVVGIRTRQRCPNDHAEENHGESADYEKNHDRSPCLLAWCDGSFAIQNNPLRHPPSFPEYPPPGPFLRPDAAIH